MAEEDCHCVQEDMVVKSSLNIFYVLCTILHFLCTISCFASENYKLWGYGQGEN